MMIERVKKDVSPVLDNRAKCSNSPASVAGSGEIINTNHGFAIELDVNHFNPEEIHVVLTDDMLTIKGERFEYMSNDQTLRRSFSRKYAIPEDVHLDTIRSHLTNAGILVITGSRKGWRETTISSHHSASKNRGMEMKSSTV